MAAYSYLGTELLFDPDSIYVLILTAPIAVLAMLDLLKPGLRGGTVYRASLGITGGALTLIEKDNLRLNFAFVSALTLYGAVCVEPMVQRLRSAPK